MIIFGHEYFFIALDSYIIIVSTHSLAWGSSMKKITSLWIFLLLAACGPTEQEKNNIAAVACNVMAESRDFESSMRIREINEARASIGAEPYLGTDEMIKESLQLGLCAELIKDDPSYNALARDKIEALRLEEERLAALRLEEMEARREEQARQEAIRIEEQARQEAMPVLRDFNKDPASYFNNAAYGTHASIDFQNVSLKMELGQKSLDIPIATIKISLFGHTLEAPFEISVNQPQWDVRGEKFDKLRAELEKLPVRNTNPAGIIFREIPMSEITFSADLK